MMTKDETKILWVLQQVSEKNAGYTIRTKPITEGLHNYDFSVNVIELSDFTANYKTLKSSYEIVVFSKLFNDLALLLASDLKKAGNILILDLFDNYLTYSPSSLARGLQRRMATLVSCADGVITSTENMKQIVQKLGYQNVVQISDPIQPNLNGDKFLNKWYSSSPELIFTWFGISGNPYYKAGLMDLIESVRRIANLFRQLEPIYQCRLVICTNNNPEIVKVLEVMRSHSISTSFQLWEPDTFEILMSQTHCVLIPTNNTPFVMAKTHNRASTALMSGCLVLVDDHPEYNQLVPHVYKNWSTFASDLLTFNKEQIINKLKKAQDFLIDLYATEKSAKKLANFLRNELIKNTESINSNNSLESNLLPIFMAGKDSGGPEIKLARKLNYLCVGSKLINPNLNYNVQFGISNKGCFLEIILDKNGIKHCLPNISSKYDISKDNSLPISISIEALSSPNQIKLAEVNKYLELKESWRDYDQKFCEYMLSLMIGFLKEIGYGEFFFHEGSEDIIYPNLTDQDLQLYKQLKTIMF
jgi:hypothetical protein